MNRRKFLRHATHSLAIPSLVGSFSFSMAGSRSMESFLRMASESNKVLVMIYLQGGNDGLNTVVPLDQLSALDAVRPHVKLPENRLLPLTGTSSAFHPALEDLKSLFDERRLGIVQNVGYPEQNYSHFRSTDIWMSGSDTHTLVNSGWPGRVLAQEYPTYPDEYPTADMPDPLSVEIGYGSSLLFQGPSASMSMVLNNVDSFYNLVDNVEEPAPESVAGDKLKFVRLIARQSQQYGQVVTAAGEKVNSHASDFPTDNELADQLRIISKLIAGGLKTPIYMVRLNGFDTHDAQVEGGDNLTGEHATLLKKLNDAVMWFMKDLEFQKTDDRVLGMTFSEFGRRIVSNASLGTDHGAAAPMFVFGNEVTGGMLGENPEIDSSMNHEDNLPMEYDYRQVNASILEQWFGVSPTESSSALLGQFDTLPIIGKPIPTAINPFKQNDGVKVYPNPLNGVAYIDFHSDGNPIDISLVDMQGRMIDSVFRGTKPTGKQQLQYNSSVLKPGRYIILFKTESGQFSRSVVKY
ncbi:MAG: DUF1501 domain-containing protein [Cyclobacteriaceae bacterium]